MSFHVGQKVVCVDASPVCDGRMYLHPVWLRRGEVYTVRGLDNFDGDLGIYLEEIWSLQNDYWNREQAFCATRFRPVVTRKTSIEVFQRILDNPRLPIREDA